jgi:hypothetical protein
LAISLLSRGLAMNPRPLAPLAGSPGPSRFRSEANDAITAPVYRQAIHIVEEYDVVLRGD